MRDDDQGREVEHRVLSCSDFIAAEARYHDSCRDSFNITSKKKICSPETKARPVNKTYQMHFVTLCNWLETEGELHTVW